MIRRIWEWVKSHFEVQEFRLSKVGGTKPYRVTLTFEGETHILGQYKYEQDARAAIAYFQDFPEYHRCYYHRGNRLR